MKSITQTYVIAAPITEVWRCLVDPKRIEQWGGGPVEMTEAAGAEFSLWGGDIHGANTKVAAPGLLEQDWYSGQWPKPSRVVFELVEHAGHTTVHLHHEGFPEAEHDDLADGWREYYLGPIKELLESDEA